MLPFQNRAAAGANPSPPLCRNFLRHHTAAGRTGSGGGEVAVNNKKLLSLPFQFVVQALPEHPVAGVTDVSKVVILLSPFNSSVLTHTASQALAIRLDSL